MARRTARAVIGAGYGDEGKGLITDWLASQGADVVVRTNGGAQAGHTVVSPDGRRHVFHHFCSGALAGVPSHLSSHFALHPMLFAGERNELAAKGGNISVTADPRAAVTTPYDMMLNQFIETRRGGARHGSCGIGFGETVERSLVPSLRITFSQISSGTDLRGMLEMIRKKWVPARLASRGGGALSADEAALVNDDAILERFLSDCAAMAEDVHLLHDRDLEGSVLFEGAQGLLLDQEYGAFPHVTRSNTGLVNMAAVAAEAGIGTIDAVYVTRAYVTRHGAGPMAHEGVSMDAFEILDPTNVPNDWQGSIRAAPLDTKELRCAIEFDVAAGSRHVDVQPSLAVTCLDQVRGQAPIFARHASRAGAEAIPDLAAMDCRLSVSAVSYGPSRDAVVRMRDRAAA